MKTIKEWLEELEEPYRTQALNNTDKNSLNCKEHSLQEAILGAFVWAESKEGAEYWNELHEKLKKNNK